MAKERPLMRTNEPECNQELDLTGKRILLVDDVEINRLILTELLAYTNVEFIEKSNGREALEAFKSSEPGYFDLIFMDIQMPEMDGYEATAELRRLKRGDAADIPIIAMTANAYQEDVSAAMASGMDGHIAKPIDLDVVTKVLSGFLAPKLPEYGDSGRWQVDSSREIME
jgi:CheY-like chemotaxis protein